MKSIKRKFRNGTQREGLQLVLLRIAQDECIPDEEKRRIYAACSRISKVWWTVARKFLFREVHFRYLHRNLNNYAAAVTDRRYALLTELMNDSGGHRIAELIQVFSIEVIDGDAVVDHRNIRQVRRIFRVDDLDFGPFHTLLSHLAYGAKKGGRLHKIKISAETTFDWTGDNRFSKVFTSTMRALFHSPGLKTITLENVALPRTVFSNAMDLATLELIKSSIDVPKDKKLRSPPTLTFLDVKLTKDTGPLLPSVLPGIATLGHLHANFTYLPEHDHPQFFLKEMPKLKILTLEFPAKLRYRTPSVFSTFCQILFHQQAKVSSLEKIAITINLYDLLPGPLYCVSQTNSNHWKFLDTSLAAEPFSKVEQVVFTIKYMVPPEWKLHAMEMPSLKNLHKILFRHLPKLSAAGKLEINTIVR